jgi:uncharacterized membrane protein
VDASNFLIGIAEVGAAFVGFSSIVAIFGRRADGALAPMDRIRVRNLVEQALIVAILGFLPLALFRLNVSEPGTWTISSVVLGVVLSLGLVLWFIRARALRKLASLRLWMAAVGTVSLGAALFLQVLNVTGWIFDSESGPYLAGLLLVLFLAGLQFALLVFSRLGTTE